MKDSEFKDLLTIEATLTYAELPLQFKQGFSGYGYQDLNGQPHYDLDNIGDDEVARIYFTASSRFKKDCSFFQNETNANLFVDYLQNKFRKKYPSIDVSLRKVTSADLDYRRKKALDEALENDEKVKDFLQKKNLI